MPYKKQGILIALVQPKPFVHDISASGSKVQPRSGGDENTLSSQLPVISLPKGGAAVRGGVCDALILPAAVPDWPQVAHTRSIMREHHSADPT
jgi:hypothetical protein